MYFYSALASSDEVFQFAIDRRVEGALVDVHGLKHHINALTQHNIQVNTPSHVVLVAWHRSEWELKSIVYLPVTIALPKVLWINEPLVE